MGLWGMPSTGGVPGTPAKDAKPWLLLARLPWHRGPRRKTRLLTLATNQGVPGLGFWTLTQICMQQASAPGSVTPGLRGPGF